MTIRRLASKDPSRSDATRDVIEEALEDASQAFAVTTGALRRTQPDYCDHAIRSKTPGFFTAKCVVVIVVPLQLARDLSY